MSSYTITITPDNASNASATLRVNLGVNGPRITELTVRAGDADGFAPDALPGFDLSRLLGLIAPAGPVIEATAGAALAAGSASAPEVVHARAGEAAERPAGRRGRAGGRKAAAKAPKAAKAAPKAAKATKQATKGAAKAAKKATERQARAYRRMPDDILEVYRQAGGATALARHYEVPRHTAQGWLRRLRTQGDL